MNNKKIKELEMTKKISKCLLRNYNFDFNVLKLVREIKDYVIEEKIIEYEILDKQGKIWTIENRIEFWRGETEIILRDLDGRPVKSLYTGYKGNDY